MTAMIDASCPKCGRRFGWCGSMSNRPACPKCGHRPPQEELDSAEAEMEAMEKLILTRPRDASIEMRRQQRVAAGLTLRQAAKLLGMTPADLSAVEQGRMEPAPELLEKMSEVYGVGQ